MAQKFINIEGVGQVVLSRRRGARNIRLSITPKGQVRVGLPYWLPYQAGISFALARKDWIIKHLPAAAASLNHNDRVGKSFRLKINQDVKVAKLSARLVGNEIVVNVPPGTDHQALQKKIREAGEKAMKKEAERLLAIRLNHLAAKHGYKYRSLKIKKLTSRWGSCSSQGDIALSIFLMQLPWPLIDYVILHELAHTLQPNHSSKFWAALIRSLPNARQLQKELRQYKPILRGLNNRPDMA